MDYTNWTGRTWLQSLASKEPSGIKKYKGRTRQVIYGLISLTPGEASPERLLALVRQYGGSKVDCTLVGMLP